jgi:hypothetical protein
MSGLCVHNMLYIIQAISLIMRYDLMFYVLCAFSSAHEAYYFFKASATSFPISFLSTPPADSPSFSHNAFMTTPWTPLLCLTDSSREAMISEMELPMDSAEGAEGRYDWRSLISLVRLV